MAISPILLHGTIQQTDNVLHNQVKQAEKGMVDQGNIQIQKEKKEEYDARHVVRHEDSTFKEERYDAKDKSKNAYSGDGGKNRKSLGKDGKIVQKATGGFDMKI